MEQFKEEIKEILKEKVPLEDGQIEKLIERPPNPRLGDYAFSCFRLAKSMKKPPEIIAEEICKDIKPKNYISKAENVGSYINFKINKEKLASCVLKEIFSKKEAYGNREIGTGKTVVVDFSSPNIAKPFGVGHLRSTTIGNSICEIYKALGYNTVRINHLGDWGTQFGRLIVAYKRWGQKRLSEYSVKELYGLYVKFHVEAKENQFLQDEAREWFRKLENGDKEAKEIWERFKEISLREFQRIYDVLGVKFDSYSPESSYNQMVNNVIEKAKSTGIAQESQGALIVNLDKYNMPACLLHKRDKSSLYATRDIAAAEYRLKKYNFDKLIYVVGADQKLHFKQVFKVLEMLGYKWAKRCVHVPFGLVRVKDAKMSTRDGNMILLEDLFQKSTQLTEKIMEEKNPHLENKREIAQQVGISAIIFADLSSKRKKDIDFNWDKFLNFEGETGPYLQYTYARFSSVLRKYGKKITDKVNFSLLDKEKEIDIIRTLGRFPETVKRAADEYEPSIIADYLLELASLANKFYNSYKVLTQDPELTKVRILMVSGIREVLGKGLSLLGMSKPQRM